ncbi:PAAR domain-containing protein [Rahnella sp. RcJ3]|uniref:PAAR domain-containing protein n=1 Tax=Rahnella sp. RcJ3 TaxID=2292446 RepID=UPI001295D3FF|nr:PAAR domain-containing protein [Rahnella sp. RcJ3]MQB51828.1 PAAR domain-containing protein [Rahnella sp. RcJ3]
MAMLGYFIRLGDKTSCGGKVVSATSRIIHHGLNLARVGDKVTCGENEGEFNLFGGIQNYTCDGIPCIGTLESFAGCPCRSRLFASEFSSSYYPEPPKMASQKTTVNEPEQHAQAAKKQMVTETKPESAPASPLKEDKPPREPVDAGFCIVDLPANVKDFGDYLFYNPVAGARELYDTLNGSGPIKPASILLLVDPDKQDPKQIETLKKAKAKVDTALSDLTMEEASFLHKHKDTIDIFMAVGNKGFGVASEIGQKYFEEIENILADIEKTYQNAFRTSGALIGQQFYVQRAIQFKKLNLILNSFMKDKLGMAQYNDLRKALGLSSRSIMHQWTQTGIGSIEGYATYIEKSAKLIKAMKKLGYIGIAFDFGSTTNKVYDACTIGREADCTKTAFTEYGALTGSVGMSAAIGPAVGGLSTTVCMFALGLVTAEVGGSGALLCTAVGVTGAIAAGEFAGSLGGELGGSIGKGIYEVIYSE